MAKPIKRPAFGQLLFNRKPSTVMHLDLNSCFATIEQQANPLLRGRPIAVAAYDSPAGCILAPSIEAKKLGIKVGMRVREGRLLCPSLQVLPPDPWKYRQIHLRLKKLLLQYSPAVTPKSIDEFFLNLEGCPAFSLGMLNAGAEIKRRIKSEIGDWLTVSVGIAPNRFLAKVAANLKKPDGLQEINYRNFIKIYRRLTLMDLPGIKAANASRLNSVGVHTLIDFYHAPIQRLQSAFQSINGYYWYLRLRGWEIDDVDFGRKSFGNMFSLPQPLTTPPQLSPILHKLVEKSSFRMRSSGYTARGVHLGLLYSNHSFWHHGRTFPETLFSPRDIYRFAFRILVSSPYRLPVVNLSVPLFDLAKKSSLQLDLFNHIDHELHLTQAIDSITEKWGNFIITPAAMLSAQDLVPDRISFGGVRELESFILQPSS